MEAAYQRTISLFMIRVFSSLAIRLSPLFFFIFNIPYLLFKKKNLIRDLKSILTDA